MKIAILNFGALASLGALVTLSAACSSSSGSGDAGPVQPEEGGALSEGGSPSDAPEEAATPEGGTADTGGSEASATSSEAGACTSSELLCAGICVPNDPRNCGTCGNDCTTLHATSAPTCVAGACAFPSLTCETGWGHCSSTASDGCEADLTTAAHCGGCTMACVTPPVCSTSGATPQCGVATAVAVGEDFALALFSNGSVDAWGGNQGGYQSMTPGQLGNGSTAANAGKPAPVSNIATATAIAAGDAHACALLAGGTVACWGDNTWGELGTDPRTTPSSSTPVVVAGLTGVTAIAVGVAHTCALISGGTVKCWGFDANNELGNSSVDTICDPPLDDSDVCTSTPTAVTGVTNATAIAAGGDVTVNESHTCAVLTDHTLKCWGDNEYGELGNGSATTIGGPPAPVAVSGISTATAIECHAAGSCALLSGGSVSCWGSGEFGMLGNGMSTTAQSTPVSVSALTDAVSLSVDAVSSTICAVKSDGTVVCWGADSDGQLGDGTTNDSSTPEVVSGLTGVTQIAGGYATECARLSAGTVTCWGFNGDQNLANTTGMTTDNTPLPVQW